MEAIKTNYEMTRRECLSLMFMNMAVLTPYEHEGINYVAKAARNPDCEE